MILLNILWPTFVLVALIFAMMITTAVRRLAHVRRVPPSQGSFASRATAGEYFAPVDLPADNLANLFEMPVLFFALVPLLLFTYSAGAVQVVVAWLFVLTRFAHSYAHVVKRDVRARFRLFVLGNILLSAMWIGFAVDMVKAAVYYQHQVVAARSMQP